MVMRGKLQSYYHLVGPLQGAQRYGQPGVKKLSLKKPSRQQEEVITEAALLIQSAHRISHQMLPSHVALSRTGECAQATRGLLVKRAEPTSTQVPPHTCCQF